MTEKTRSKGLDPNAPLSFSFYYPFLCLFRVESCVCQLAEWILLAIQAHENLFWFA